MIAQASTKKDIASLEERLADLKEKLATSIKTRNEMDGKMQSRYDTQREEWALQCSILEDQVKLVEESIKQLKSVSETVILSDIVSVGHTVTLIIDHDAPMDYLLAESLGGQELSSHRVTLSVKSPVGQAILGRKKGDDFIVNLGNEKVTIQIADVR